MKRNLELLKQMLLTAEESNGPTTFSRDSLPEGFEVSFLEILHHFNLLLDHGLIKGDATNCSVCITRLTWDGHDFLENSMNQAVWNAAIKHCGNIAFTAFQAALNQLSVKMALDCLTTSLQSFGLGS